MSFKRAVLAMLVAMTMALVAYIGPNLTSLVKFNGEIESPEIKQLLEMEPEGILIETGAEQGIFAINVEADGFKAIYPQTLTLKDVNDASVTYEGKGNQRVIVMGSDQLDIGFMINSIKDLDPKLKAKMDKICERHDSPYELMREVVCITPKDLSLFDSKGQMENKLTLLMMKKVLVPQCDSIVLMEVGSLKIIQFVSEGKDKPRQISSNLYTDSGGVKVIVSGPATQEEMNYLYRTAVFE